MCTHQQGLKGRIPLRCHEMADDVCGGEGDSKDNKMVDWLSRFEMKLFTKEARKQCDEKGWTLQEMQDVECPDVRIY